VSKPEAGSLDSNRDALKEKFAGAFNDADPDPGQGADDNADDDLNEEIEGGAPDPDADPAADPAPEPSNQDGGDEDLLKGETFTKQGENEFVPKKAFLARLKKEREARKKDQERLKSLSAWEGKDPASYQRWDQNKDRFEGAAKFVADLHRGTQANIWAKPILDAIMKGQPVDWKQMVNHLKPMMAPFWDGIEDEEGTIPGTPPKEVTELQSRLDKLEATQRQKQDEKERQAHIAERTEARKTEETKVWARHKDFAGDPLYRDMLYDRASAIQMQLPAGTVVSLEKVADDLFNGLKAKADAATAARKAARDKARKAAGEGGGGKPGIPIPAAKPDPNAKPVDPLRKQRNDLVARFSGGFSA